MSNHILFVFSLAAAILVSGATLPLRAQNDDKDPRQQMIDDMQKAQEKMTQDYDAGLQKQAEDWTKLSAQMEAQYQELSRKMDAQREELKKLVEQQWTDFHESTNKSWVDYNKKGDALSQVDFEKGKIAVEVLVPVEEISPKKNQPRFSELDDKEKAKLQALAEEKIRGQTKKILSEKDEGKTEVLKDQVQTREGKPVTEKNADAFVKKEIAPKMVVEEKPVVSKDGKPRMKVRVEISLIPDHLKVRAARYSPQIASCAEKYALDPALLYAVIHTESEFNPKARSKTGAMGLMQIMPKTAGNEAYQYLYKKETLITPDYLYNPDNNILLGATYLHMLETRHYGKIKDPDNRRTLTIAAYNCGPGAVRKAITSKNDVDSLDNAQVVGLVRQFAPKETQAYVPRVEGRMALYRKP